MRKIAKYIIAGAMFVLPMLFIGHKTEAKDSKGNIVVVIDAGHGEADSGSIGTTQVYEANVNLAIAKSFHKYLAQYEGVSVYLTRSDNEWMTNTGRAMIAKSLHADFLISVHNNSGSSTNSGSIVYKSISPLYTQATNDMGNLINAKLEAIGIANGGVQTRPDDRFPNEDYYTLIAEGVRAGFPSIIVEHLFLSNPSDCELVSNPDGTVKTDMTDKMGQADAEAVAEYFQLKKRTAVADDETTINLRKNYGVTLSTKDGSAGKWYSNDTQVATVDENGVVTAVGAGAANIVYKVNGENGGSCTINVEEVKPKSITGGIDPTFYETADDMDKIDLSTAFGFVTYTDGTSRKVALDTVGEVDKAKVGVQDIAVSYQGLNGILRIINNNESYVPEVTQPVEPDEPLEEETTVEAAKTEEAKEDAEETAEESKIDVKSVIKYVLVVVIVLLIGGILYLMENNKRHGNRYRRRRY